MIATRPSLRLFSPLAGRGPLARASAHAGEGRETPVKVEFACTGDICGARRAQPSRRPPTSSLGRCVAPSLVLILTACGAQQPLTLSADELTTVKAASRDDRPPSPSLHAAAAKSHADWPAPTLEAISAGEVIAGMTREQVTYAWGLPTRRINPILSDASTERWWYRQVSPGIVLDFHDGRLTNVHYEWEPDWGPESPVPRGQSGFRLVDAPPH